MSKNQSRVLVYCALALGMVWAVMKESKRPSPPEVQSSAQVALSTTTGSDEGTPESSIDIATLDSSEWGADPFRTSSKQF